MKTKEQKVLLCEFCGALKKVKQEAGRRCVSKSGQHRFIRTLQPKKENVGPNWNRLRILIDKGLSALGMGHCKLETNSDGDMLDVTYDIHVAWEPSIETYTVLREVIIRGVHTFRNGDPGYPDDVDMQELETFKAGEINNLVRYVCTQIATLRIDDALTSFFEEEMEVGMEEGALAK